MKKQFDIFLSNADTQKTRRSQILHCFLCFKTSGWNTILSFKTEVLQLMIGNRDTQRRCDFDQSDQINCVVHISVTKALTLERAIEICRAHESAKQATRRN